MPGVDHAMKTGPDGIRLVVVTIGTPAAESGMNIGGIVIEPVLDGRILSKLHGTRPFPPADSPLMADQDGMVHPDGLVESTLGGFLVRTADRVVLVDAGGGPTDTRRLRAAHDRLRRSG